MSLSGITNASLNIENDRQAILPGAPWLIAHKSMLGVDRPYKITLNGKDYVLWQNKQGEVFALDNVCPHMQAPLSDGWVCQQRNTIACPFHALEFDGKGRLYSEGNSEGKPIAQTVELIVKDDTIWTYGGYEPRLPVPDLIPRLTKEFEFMGVAGEKSISANFLSCLKINSDFNHPYGTHREPFKFRAIEVKNYKENGYKIELTQEITKEDNTLRDILKYPALLTTPKILINKFEYSYPAIVSILTKTVFGEIAQFFLLYPERENQTKTFVLLYAKPKNKLLLSLLKKSFLKAFDLVVQQDTNIVENLYPPTKPKIKLPNEEIMFYTEKLYSEW
jgi:phenylpropionate dioxygenase-like ring-hydroxylating dioxygenase large terminal subunit